MQSPANKQPAVPPVQVTLDGQAVALSSRQGRSLQAIRSHLETIALKKHRVLFSLLVNGVPINLGDPVSPFKTFQKVVGRTIPFSQLTFQLVSVAADQVNSLHERVQHLALQVMINDWSKAEALWWDLMPQLKDPLLTLSFVPASVASLPHGEEINEKAIRKFTTDLVSIFEQIEAIIARKELLEFSNALEHQVLPWLRAVGHCIYRFSGPEPG